MIIAAILMIGRLDRTWEEETACRVVHRQQRETREQGWREGMLVPSRSRRRSESQIETGDIANSLLHVKNQFNVSWLCVSSTRCLAECHLLRPQCFPFQRSVYTCADYGWISAMFHHIIFLIQFKNVNNTWTCVWQTTLSARLPHFALCFRHPCTDHSTRLSAVVVEKRKWNEKLWYKLKWIDTIKVALLSPPSSHTATATNSGSPEVLIDARTSVSSNRTMHANPWAGVLLCVSSAPSFILFISSVNTFVIKVIPPTNLISLGLCSECGSEVGSLMQQTVV